MMTQRGFSLISDPERIGEAREKLDMLRSQGFQFIVTSDDGETWEGSYDHGLEIDKLMSHCFLGRIIVNAPQPSVTS